MPPEQVEIGVRVRAAVAALACWALLLLPAGIQAAHGAPAQAEGQVVTLKLKWRHQFQFAGYYAAIEQGFYRDAGLDVRIEEADSEEESIDAVLRGEAEYGVAASDLVVARGQGKPVVVLAPIFQHSAAGIIIRDEEDIQSVHDLIGKRLMLEPHSEEILAYLESEGVSVDEIVVHPHTFDPGPLVRSDVDAMSGYVTDEPFLLLEEGLDYRFISPRAGGVDFYGDTLFTTDAEVSENPERVEAFLEASLRGWEFAFENVDHVIDLILADYSTRHSEEHLEFEARQMRRLVLPDTVDLGHVNRGRWERIAETYVGVGAIGSVPDIDALIYDGVDAPRVNWIHDLAGGLVAIIALLALLATAYALMSAVRARSTGRDRAPRR